MSFTAEVKDELSRIEPKRACCLKAELAALVRIEGTLHITGPDRYRLEVATETAPVARTVIKLLTASTVSRPNSPCAAACCTRRTTT